MRNEQHIRIPLWHQNLSEMSQTSPKVPRLRYLNQFYKFIIIFFRKSTRNLLFAWTCICFYIILYLILLAGLTRKVYRHIIRSMKHSLNIGMGHYLQNDMWKLTIDRLQFDLQCCGIEIFTEWHEIPWLDKYHVNANSDIVKQ